MQKKEKKNKEIEMEEKTEGGEREGRILVSLLFDVLM